MLDKEQWLLFATGSTTGDVFRELCLTGKGERLETATAMEETELRVIPCCQFFELLSSDALLEGFTRYLSLVVRDKDLSDYLTRLHRADQAADDPLLTG